MALKDKLVNLEDLKAVHDADAAEVSQLKSALTHIGVENLPLDYYPVDILPQVVRYKNKSCGGFDTTAKVPLAYVDKDGQDIVEFSFADLRNSGVTKISFPTSPIATTTGQRCVIWTAGEFCSNMAGTSADGIYTVDLTKYPTVEMGMITFQHGKEWIQYEKDYSEDEISRGVTGWLRLSDLKESEIDEKIETAVGEANIDSTQISTELKIYETTADKVAEIHESTQIITGAAGSIMELRTVANPRLRVSVYDVKKTESISFIPNTSANQWGPVIGLAKSNYAQVFFVGLTSIDPTPSRSWITFDSTTRIATLDVAGMLADFPTTEIIMISSDANKAYPSVVANNMMHISEFEWLDTSEDTTVQPVNLILPSKVPAVVGMPAWCYYENIYGDGYIKDDDVHIETSNYGTRKNAFNRTASDAGNYAQVLWAYRGKDLASTATLNVLSVAKATSETKSVKVLCIGDSKTEASGKRVRVNALVADDEYLNLEFIGTHGTAPTLSEGYSGRNIIEVCKNAQLGSYTNIFYDNTITADIKFNFSKGVSAIGQAPDIVFIDHGANQYYQNWNTILECYESIIDSIQAYDSNIKIVVCIQEATALVTKPDQLMGNKNAYGYMNPIANSYSIQKMLAAFDNRESENVFICPQYLCVDLYQDFPLAMLPVSEVNPMKVAYCLDAVHPGSNNGNWSASTAYKTYDYIRRNGLSYAAVKASTGIDPATDDGTYWSPIMNPEAGYYKIGDMYYAVIKYILSLN